MSGAPRPPSPSAGSAPTRTGRRGALAAALVVALLASLLAGADSPPAERLRLAFFDACQAAFPRVRSGDPVVVVEIDEPSLRAIGQWPWPRARVAELVERIVVAAPAAVAIDALFVEPDRLAPNQIVRQLSLPQSAVAALSRQLPDGDARLAAALRGSPVVLGSAGTEAAAGSAARPAPGAALRIFGDDPLRFVRHYPALLQSLPALVAAARSQALINGEPARGVHRRVPALAAVGDGVLLPGLALETLRVAGGGAIAVQVGPEGARRASVAGLEIPLARDGGWWLHFSPWWERPSLSAADLLAGRYDREMLAGRIVLVGFTALGLQDLVTTPLGRMPGVALHAEAIENALDGATLARPEWVRWLECAVLATLALVAAFGAARPALGATLLAVGATIFLCVAVGLFAGAGVLVDAANPLAGGAAAYVAALAASLADSQRQRRLLRAALAESREAQLRVQTELDTARRIQLGMLPQPEALAGIPGLDLAALSEPARAVGGDLYDFFVIEGQVFFVIGDVSGKGLPSALLMALAKAHLRSAAQRAGGEPGAALRLANAAIAGDNPESLFVTVLCGCLDPGSGTLRLANAGHDAPLLKGAAGVVTGPAAQGPPLCTVDEFPYAAETLRLEAGVALCLYTDGVTDARAPDGALFGRARLLDCLVALPREASARTIVDTLGGAVRRHASGAEQADDITLLVLTRRPAEPS